MNSFDDDLCAGTDATQERREIAGGISFRNVDHGHHCDNNVFCSFLGEETGNGTSYDDGLFAHSEQLQNLPADLHHR